MNRIVHDGSRISEYIFERGLELAFFSASNIIEIGDELRRKKGAFIYNGTSRHGNYEEIVSEKGESAQRFVSTTIHYWECVYES